MDALFEAVHPDDIDRVQSAVEDSDDTLSDGQMATLEHRVVRPDGTIRWVEVRIVPIHDEAGDLSDVLGVTIDITDRKRTELELQRQKECLDRFASVVSHDLRNPLNVAAGYIDLLQARTDLDEGVESELAAVDAALDRMNRIIEDLLWQAKEGQDIGARTTVALDRVARDAWEQVDTDDATLVTDTDARVSADPARLQQLFENLMRYSVEHGSTNDQPVAHGSDDTLTVRVGALEGGGGFYVEDDGCGIPADEREAVLGMGYSTAGSTGFGLSIVETIAKGHGWTLDITESADGGARFEFTDVDVQ